MTEQKHTPEPWHIGAMESGQVAIDAANGSAVTGWLDPDDARRIVAAINYCQGLDVEVLEYATESGITARVRIQQCFDEMRDIANQRDQLLAALEAMLEIHGVTQKYADTHIYIPQSWVEVSDIARAALAATK